MRKNLTFAALLFVVLLVQAAPVWADGTTSTIAGQVEYNALKGLLTGNLGLAVALCCAAYGCYLWLVAQRAGPGFLLIIIGATMALLPQFMDAMHVNMCPMVTLMGGTCANTNFTAGTVN